MPGFYQQLEKLEQILDGILDIQDLGNGLLQVNGQMVDSSQQLEFLSPTFFYGTAADNSTNKAFKVLLLNLGILSPDLFQIPLLRDIPLRSQHLKTTRQEDQLFVRFMREMIIPNQWTLSFTNEYDALIAEIKAYYRKNKNNLSGQMSMKLGSIDTFKLIVPDSMSDKDLEMAAIRSLDDKVNRDAISNFVSNLLSPKAKIALNIRGVGKTVQNIEELQGNNLGGGHQYFVLLDQANRRFYAINNTRNATDENPRAYFRQIMLYLETIGQPHNYRFHFLQGKSRQPDDQSYLNQVCSVSQFIHYAALLAGEDVEKLRDIIPAKVSTLFYLLQYASTNNDQGLKGVLDQLIVRINDKLEKDNKESQDKLLRIIDTLITNIMDKKNGRNTDYHSQEKVASFMLIRNSLVNDPTFMQKNEAQYIDEIRAACKVKRNAWHFWAEPHSVVEFEDMLADRVSPSL